MSKIDPKLRKVITSKGYILGDKIEGNTNCTNCSNCGGKQVGRSDGKIYTAKRTRIGTETECAIKIIDKAGMSEE